jgi:threonylcarbamoyladenosine tRNA methylthiotransferase MtaB
MPQVPQPVIKERARRLREATSRRKAAWLQSLVGTTQKVLAERGGHGHAENFAPVRIARPISSDVGKILSFAVTGIEDGKLIGEKIERT